MVKLFRKLRHKFVAQKRFGNYLIYAVGEIVLVVIGILIALAINNNNQERVIRQKEQTYLAGLKNEFSISKAKLAELMKVNRQSLESTRSILGLINTRAEIQESEFSRLLYESVAFDLAYNPNNSLLMEMISSGSLKDLSNSRLRVRLSNWISYTDDIATQERTQAAQREVILDMFRSGEGSIRTIFDDTGLSKELGLEPGNSKNSNLELLGSNAFENNLLMYLLTSELTETAHYAPLMDELEEILALIESEIDMPE